jgi:hypothetical protein
MLSAAVQMKPPLPPSTILMSAMSPEQVIRAQLPTESEVREAMSKVARDLHDMVEKRTAGEFGWEIGDLEFQTPNILPDGSVNLRGYVIIQRED